MIRRYAYALRTARPRQLRARVVRPLRRRVFPRPHGAHRFLPVAAAEALWRSPAFRGPDVEHGVTDVLGRRIAYPPENWALPDLERLRRFHLHYGEEVLELVRRGRGAAAAAALASWISGNPPRTGDPWHPYPLSTRVGNWIAAATLEPSLAAPAVVESLRRQLAYLERNVEEDILGNHVIRNARALVLGGVAFDDADLVARGLAILRRELPEQVLPDGGHYERSPVYHLVVLRDLLEVRAATEEAWLDEPIERMRVFAAALARPDGAPALFNDGTLDLVPELELPAAPKGLAVFPDTGYAVLRRSGLWLAFDCGPPCPPFLPPHAHADALSFQLWLDGRPVVVDPGTSTYEPGSQRTWERGTRAHSTVAVGGDQFEAWAAFRSGPLPAVRLLEAADNGFVAEVAYRGVRHRRAIAVRSDELVVDDAIEAPTALPGISSLPLAPDAAVDAEPSAGEAVRRERSLSQRFFELGPAPALEVRVRGAGGWRVALRRAAVD